MHCFQNQERNQKTQPFSLSGCMSYPCRAAVEVTAPQPRRRGPRQRPHTHHDYPLRSNPPTNNLIRDNLVLETSAALPTMSEGVSSDSVSKKLDALLQQMETDQLKLYDKIDSPADTVSDIDHQ